jgi:flagellar biosynthesis/type III secretory pathway ATPase
LLQGVGATQIGQVATSSVKVGTGQNAGSAFAKAQAMVQARERMASAREFVVEGTLNRMVGMTLEAVGCEAAVGGRCLVDTAEGRQIEAEVVGFSGDIRGLMPGARVIPTHSESSSAADSASAWR